MTLTYKEVAEILKIIDASDCEEVVLELEGVKLQVRRGSSVSSTPQIAEPPPSNSELSPTLSSSSLDKPSSSRNLADISATEHDGAVEVRAPMVGTFYRRPSPEKPPLVEPGDSINPGTALCLIEVMKLYTTIEADCTGTISKVFPDDGDLVEFDQLLFVIDTD